MMCQQPSSSVCYLNQHIVASLLISRIPNVKILRCIYGARVSNKIFDEDHTKLLLSLGYVQFDGVTQQYIPVLQALVKYVFRKQPAVPHQSVQCPVLII